MYWLSHPTLLAAYLLIVGSLILAFTKSSLFFLSHVHRFEKDYSALSERVFQWLIWPAIAANFFFEHLFGHRGDNFWSLYTWRSISVTLLISLFANSICVVLILTSMPEDVIEFDLSLVRLLSLSYMIFLIFNFLGDLVSVGITRHVLSIIISGRCNFLRYLFIDVVGVVIGYIVTLAPSIAVVSYCIAQEVEINEFIRSGLLGGLLTPFFLFIFATTGISIAISIFAFVSILSITIPTAIYIALMGFCYFGYRIYQMTFKEKDVTTLVMVLNALLTGGKILLYLSPLIIGISILWNQNW